MPLCELNPLVPGAPCEQNPLVCIATVRPWGHDDDRHPLSREDNESAESSSYAQSGSVDKFELTYELIATGVNRQGHRRGRMTTKRDDHQLSKLARLDGE